MTPTFTFAGVYLRVAGDQVIWPVEVVIMSPHHGNVTGLITLSPPPLCSQFPIIHLIRWWRQGDTSHWGSCITNPTNTPRKTVLCSETCLILLLNQLSPIDYSLSIDCSLPSSTGECESEQLQSLKSCEWGDSDSVRSRGRPNWSRLSLQSQRLVTGDAQLWPNFWCQAESLQCGLENIMTFLLWTVISRTINGWLAYYIWDCRTEFVEHLFFLASFLIYPLKLCDNWGWNHWTITPRSLSFSLFGAHWLQTVGNVLFQSIGFHFPNQNFRLGPRRYSIRYRLPFELFSLASSEELDIPCPGSSVPNPIELNPVNIGDTIQ